MYKNSINLVKFVVAEPGETYQPENLNHWIEVLVDCPGTTGLFTYRLPNHLKIKPGDILSVPFGTQKVGAIAIRLLIKPNIDLPAEKIREVEDIVSEGFFPNNYWELLNRVAAYYYTPLIQVIRVALPPGLLGRSQRRIRLLPDTEIKRQISSSLAFLSPAAQQVLNLLQSQAAGDYSFVYLQQKIKTAYKGVGELLRFGLVESYLEPPRLNRPKRQKAVTLIGAIDDDLSSRQREILEVLRRSGGELWQSELLQISHTSSTTLKTMAEKGYIVIEEKEVLRTEQGLALAQDSPKTLNTYQANALTTIQALNGFAQVLLHGITGSGKTEVYLQAINPLLNQGKSALILVPEIGLTPQLTDRFRARFRGKVRVYHSALSEGERYDTWRQMLTGEPQIVIGTRSAIFAPLPNLGLIILDEEHDSSFKQDSPIPTYHARTVAQWRAELENCPLVLGSATPSLESWVSLTNTSIPTPHSYYLSLPERIYSRPLPPVQLVDMRLELQQGNRSIFSRPLQAALHELQEKQQQGILFIHRRGHSTFVSCRSCGYVIECPHCDVSLSYHHSEEGAPQLLRCHYCNYTRLHPQHCPECSSPYLKFFGSGTQRVAQELAKQFPQLSFIRFDSDTTRNKGAHRTLLTRFANGEAHLLVGTQMITKGLDLHQVTFVGVVSADGLLHLSDYRASERAFQTLTQVAGRAGRGDDPGKVIVQTYTPEHPVIAAMQQHDYQSFCQTELEQRQALNYPPYGRLILLRLTSLDPIQVQNTAQIIATALSSSQEFQEFEILGPAPANVMRVANRYRWQILLKFPPDALPQLPDWDSVRSLCSDSVSLTIDIDPLNIL
ncbi:primosomal protein N' [Umezakia ovalisporum]|uniref:Replication restart protein PriA n=1 Tax=Umezakia ovalisporum FSS-62 TaxID=2971776 RepID=A0AA43GYM7_9CYAN|nr:primosomal protein N' [Umezakia ovalisporum]MDH6064249.1 primosomal protein N' [Umezakia ovalisporum FSS-62]MDH6066801.1 primosomal protein N' [Umezakia ovalisporum APH033B]MDH6104155.1 primosomal protein N' [Umezakia ovalisporum ANA283AFssAo]